MPTDPLPLLKETASEIERAGAENVYSTTSGAWVREFGAELEKFEPFATIAAGWLVGPRGGGRIGAGVSGLWVWHRLLAGADPETVLAKATAAVAQNSYEAWDIRPARGITVGGRIDIEPTNFPSWDVEPVRERSRVPPPVAFLCRGVDLPISRNREIAFGEDAFDEMLPQDTAALVQTFVVEPALIPIDADRSMSHLSDAWEKRNAFAKRHRLALGLMSGGPVDMPITYCLGTKDNILSSEDGIFGTPRAPIFSPSKEVDIIRMLATVDLLGLMEKPKALELSIDRLMRSRLSRTTEDRIIDLGMAAEIVLMHVASGGGDGKGEITNKMSARAAWLLGKDVDDRIRIADATRDLYSARSKVVHTGEAEPKHLKRLDAWDKLVADIAIELLARSRFPDWKRLVLGD